MNDLMELIFVSLHGLRNHGDNLYGRDQSFGVPLVIN